MSTEIRPRIKINSSLQKQEILDKINKKINDPNTKCSGWAKENYALICAPKSERKIWTPQLNLQIDETEEGTEVRGVIGPSSAIWTAFAFTFAMLGFLTFVALFWGLSQLSLDHSANILWAVPVLLLLILGVYILTQVGKNLSKNEVKHLQDFVESSLSE